MLSTSLITFIVLFALVISVDLKVITDAHRTEQDDIVNINIKNGAALRISSPAGEIIVPSERKNVRIKTIDVFEEKNSPSQKEIDQPHLFYKRLFSEDGNPRQSYPWQQHLRPKPVNRQRQWYPKVNNENNQDYEYYDNFGNSYEYNDDFPITIPEKPTHVKLIPNMAQIIDFILQLINLGKNVMFGNYEEIKRSLLTYAQNVYSFLYY